MREDQRRRLADVSERLAEVVIRDADPDSWGEASSQDLGDMTREDRGDQAWCRKTAAQSVALLVRVEALLAVDGGSPAPPSDDDPEAEIKRAERAAQAALARCAKQRA